MTFEPLSFKSIPKREAPERTWNHEAAAALLAVVTGDAIDGAAPTATDGTAYADQKLARAAANKTKRLLGHVLPEGQSAKTAIFGLDKKGQPTIASASAGAFGYAVWLIATPPAKTAKA
jgi:hypothetical protein